MFLLSTKAETSLLSRIAAPFVAGALLALTWNSRSLAAPETYVVPDDGYGVNECLKENSGCGRIVADAWCESHGHGPASAFGRAEDMTASIPASEPRQPSPPGATVISCSD